MTALEYRIVLVYAALCLALVVATACSQTVDHKAAGGVEVDAEVVMTQDICVPENGFDTPASRRECILCLREPKLCPKCEKYAPAN